MIAKMHICKQIYTSWFVFFIQNRIIFLFKTFPYIGVCTYMFIYINKLLSSQSCGFSSSYIWMWELDYKESWVPKNWWFWTMVLEKTLESPLDCKKIQPVHHKGNQPWIFIERTDAEDETSVLWPLDAKNWLPRKDPDDGKDWRREEKGMTENEMVGWHH